MSECLFCKFVQGEKQPHRVWEDDDYLAFLDINPIKPGHTLLVPKRHDRYLFEVDEPGYCGLLLTAKWLSRPLCQATSAERVGMIVEGFEVPHIHIHLVPLHNRNELTPEKGRPAPVEALRAMAAKLAEAIEEYA